MRKKYPNILRMLVVLTMIVSLTAAMVVPATAQDCDDVTLSAYSGTVGTAITVNVTDAFGWEGQPVTVLFDGSPMSTSPSSVTVSSTTASASAQITIPATIAGTHAITVMVGYTACTKIFTVNPSISVSPSSGAAGSSVTITGKGFGTTVPVTATVKIGGKTVVSGVTVESNGSFTATGTVPALTAGAHDVYAIDGAANEATKVNGFTAKPSLVITPSAGLAGATVAISGSGWTASTAVDIAFGGDYWTTVTAGSTGALSAAVATPTNKSGTVAVQATQGANTAAASFTVQSRALTVTPSSGPEGIYVTITGGSLTPGGTVAVGALTINGAAWNTAVIEITTTGALTPTTLMVPASAATGANTILLTDSGGLSAAGIFTAVKPTISVSPTTGPASSSFVVTGSGWVPNKLVQISFDATQISAVFSDASGNIAASLVVPTVAAGKHSISAADSLGNSATAVTFTIPGAAISIAPGEGAAGSAVTISGTGFQGYSGITIMIGSYTVPVNPLTSPLGDFSAAITVPGIAPGAQVVTVEDGEGNTATTFFIVLPAPQTVEAALAGIANVLDIVWDYASGDWLFYDPDDAAGSDLENLVVGTGYWMKLSEAATLIYGGHQYVLSAGWNSVGWLGM
jgi:hypothetical protein